MKEIDKPEERAFIVFGVLKRSRINEREYLFELKNLAITAGANVIDLFLQRVDRFNPAFLIGKGKLSEIKARIKRDKINLIIFGNDLTPLQHENLEEFFKVKVVDRTELILDIFAQHARSKEGKIQVELAQLKYRLSQLIGRGKELSRLGGGIGTRGPGETKLEVDRRRIKEKISRLQRELKRVKKSRIEQRKGRKKAGIPQFALIGYTNVGKSSILNLLARSDVLVEDKLFATLDPTTRRVYIGEGIVVLLSDTVGFIEDLPSDLLEAFKATLEEIQEADFLVLVLDASNFDIDRELNSVYSILKKLEISDKPILYVFNKMDLVDVTLFEKRFSKMVDRPIFISVKEKWGIDDLKREMRRLVKNEAIDFS